MSPAAGFEPGASDSGPWTRVRIRVRIRVGDSVNVRVGQGYVFGRNQET